jgi:shikimate dehydrogenase
VKTRPGRLVLLGHPLGHSLSPLMQNAALRAAGIPLHYEPLDVPPRRLSGTLVSLVADRAAGNVTIPHKTAVAKACRRLRKAARQVGAVNTFWTEHGGLVGDNTDVHGFSVLARQVLGRTPRGAVVAVIGAGGGAAAVCAAVAEWPGARVRIANRNAERARRLVERYPEVATLAMTVADAVRDATVVVNATPIGLRGDAVPVPVDALRADAAVMDLAYRRGETPWVRAAREAGHPAADGLEMLIAQGACAFERWFGITPDVDDMRAAVAT